MACTVPRSLARARSQRTCVVCGQDNPRGLRIRYEPADGGAVKATWNPEPCWEGFEGVVHGGIVSTVLDEAMSKAVAACGCEALTAELRVRFRRPVTAAGGYRIRGWVVDRLKRRIRTEAELSGPDGAECAHAWAVFLSLR
jgi:acyl-coenzyme A thioesterase PaaI-like protein